MKGAQPIRHGGARLPEGDTIATTAWADDAAAAPAATPRYVAFLSYSHADRAAAASLHSFLENYRVPADLVGRTTRAGTIPARLRPIFRDREDLTAAADLTDEIEEALAASGALIVLCSPAAAASRWVDTEVATFKSHHGDARVFAAVVGGVPFASDNRAHAADECFPPALRRRANGRRAEPLAADLRRAGDGVQAGRLKLVAGLIGVPLDDLVHRDARRRHRRTLAVIVALMIGMALTSGLAVFALRARNEAVRQRAEAEGLIEFMVGDLRKKLEPVGRLSAMDSLGTRALDYYRRQNETDLDPDSLGRRARVVRLLGEIENQRGNLDTALHDFQTASASTAELLARESANPQRIFDHAQNVFFLGSIAFRRGNLAVAEQQFLLYRRLADRLVAIDPRNPAWQDEVGYANSNLAALFLQQGRNAEAVAGFAQVVRFAQAAADRKPGDVAAQLDLADAHNWLAAAQERLGALDAATANNHAAGTMLDAVSAHDPDNNLARMDRIIANNGLARIALQRGDLAAARATSAAAVADIAPLLAADANNADWLYDAAMAQTIRAEVLLAGGDAAAAARALDIARHVASQLTARDNRVTKWRMLLVRERVVRAALLLGDGDPVLARAVADAALAQIGGLPSKGRDVSETRYLSARARWIAAAALTASGDAVAANATLRRIADDLPADPVTEEPRMIVLRAAALHRLGDSKAESALLRRLHAVGWASVNPDDFAMKIG